MIDREKNCLWQSGSLVPGASGWQGWLLALLLALTGCVARPPALPEAASELRGKVGVTWPGERFSARFHWQQAASRYRLDLWGPLGQGRVTLAGQGDQLQVQDVRGNVLDEGPADAVMEAQLGWSVPLSVLPWWADGAPDRSRPFVIDGRDSSGRITEFRQLGWRVQVEGFAPLPGVLPSRLRLTRTPYDVIIVFSDREILEGAGPASGVPD